MNSFFSSIGPNVAARIPQAQRHFSCFLPMQKNAGSFVFKPVNPIEIEAEILSISLTVIRYTDYTLVPLAFWNVRAKSSQALCANVLTIPL